MNVSSSMLWYYYLVIHEYKNVFKYLFKAELFSSMLWFYYLVFHEYKNVFEYLFKAELETASKWIGK